MNLISKISLVNSQEVLCTVKKKRFLYFLYLLRGFSQNGNESTE